jgi:plasmid maintenance system killer protein
MRAVKFGFRNDQLKEVYYDGEGDIGHGPAVNKGFRKVMGFVAQAHSELSLRQHKSLHYHQLGGDRSHQHAMSITDLWRLVVEREKEDGGIKLLIISVEDYH